MRRRFGEFITGRQLIIPILLAAEAKLSTAAGAVVERAATVTRFMPELSFIPAALPAAK
jgi:hypothetical protein